MTLLAITYPFGIYGKRGDRWGLSVTRESHGGETVIVWPHVWPSIYLTTGRALQELRGRYTHWSTSHPGRHSLARPVDGLLGALTQKKYGRMWKVPRYGQLSGIPLAGRGNRWIGMMYVGGSFQRMCNQMSALARTVFRTT